MEIRITTIILTLAYFLVVYIQPKTLPLDIDTWRLFSYSILNTLSLGFIYYNKNLTSSFYQIIKSKLSIVVIAFIAWSFSSYLYALNGNEVILRSFYFVNFYISIIAIYCFLNYIKPSANLISIFLLLNFIFLGLSSYLALYDITRFFNYDFSFNDRLAGFYPNRNITQAIYLIHLPFIVYILNFSKSIVIKIISGSVGVLLVNIVFLMGARTSYVIIIGIIILLVLLYFLNSDLRRYIKNFSIIIFLGFIISSSILGTDNSAFVTNRATSINFQEESTATRLRYYKYGFQEFFSNPLIGVGSGNWKIHSINMDKEFIRSYVIPYTMHNDLLEIAVELGIIGVVLYSLIFYFTIINLWNLFSRYKNKELALTIFIALLTYFVDSLINFPFTRSSQLFILALLVSLSQYFKKVENENIA